MNPMHSAKSAEHGTPVEIVESARKVLDYIDLDPASSDEFNKVVKAIRYFTKEDSGLDHGWYGANVFLNPPGTCGFGEDGLTTVCRNKKACSCKLVTKFWSKLNREYSNASFGHGIWIGFSIEQLRSLQKVGWIHPLAFPTCFPSKRMKFAGNNPTHANYITYIGNSSFGIERFVEEFKQYGIVQTGAVIHR